jgi:hypothetical protein
MNSVFGAPLSPVKSKKKQISSSQMDTGRHNPELGQGFEENKGQVELKNGSKASLVSHVMNSGAAQIYLLRSGGIAWQITKVNYPENYSELIGQVDGAEERELLHQLDATITVEKYRMDMYFIGANANAEILTEGKSADYSMYYNYNALNVHTYQRVTYKNLYPGIDWVIKSTPNGMKQEFIVHPGASVSQIQMQYTHQENLFLDENGNLVQTNRLGEFIESKPVSFQNETAVETAFKLNDGVVTFVCSEYDKSKTLIVDPEVRLWATYYGGGLGSGGQGFDSAEGVTTDANGNVFMTGRTFSANAMANLGYDNTYNGNYDAFLVKFNSSGVRQWATYLGGSVDDWGEECTTDASGNVYCCGSSNSTTGFGYLGYQNTFSGGASADAYLSKFNTNGTLIWSTWLGLPGYDVGFDCCTDASGNVYMAGTSAGSSSVIATAGAYSATGNGFLIKFSASGVRLWGTMIGGTPEGCAIDPSGNIYTCGWTTGSTLPNTTGGFQPAFAGSADAFLLKLSSTGGYLWATYYGGSLNDTGRGCAVDGFGNVFICGVTASTNGIASNGFQNTLLGAQNVFLAKFNSTGALQWGTYYGGTEWIYSKSCAAGPSGTIYLSAYTNCAGCTNLSSPYGFQQTASAAAPSSTESVLVKFNSAGNRLVATYYGGGSTEHANDCRVDALGNSYLCGHTVSTSNIATSNAHQTSFGGNADAYLVKFYTPTPLAAEIDQVELNCMNNCHTLVWNTLSESEIDYFVVEYSSDGISFEEVKKIASKGNSSERTEYQSGFLCQESPIRYYRLSQVDKNGQVTKMAVVSGSNCSDANNEIIVAPNPGNAYLTVIYSLREGDEIRMTTLDGKQILKQQIHSTTSSFVLDVSDLASGCYILQIGTKTVKWLKN